MFKLLITTISTIILFSCSVTYQVAYDTYLADSPSKSLTFKDDKFYFEFLPVPNGVYFKINNLTNSPATLIWDRCYFIDPYNNASKLLNVDILREEQETVLKSKYESVIPPGALFARFTTSALKLRIFSSKIEKISTYLFTKDFSISNTYVAYKRFITYGKYWPEIVKIPKSKLKNELEGIRNYVLNYNNMGIGFAIEINKEVFDYKFDFRFKKVIVYKVNKVRISSPPYVKGELELVATMEDEHGWEWMDFSKK